MSADHTVLSFLRTRRRRNVRTFEAGLLWYIQLIV